MNLVMYQFMLQGTVRLEVNYHKRAFTNCLPPQAAWAFAQLIGRKKLQIKSTTHDGLVIFKRQLH